MPTVEAMLMIRPPGRSAIAGIAARLTRKTPFRSTPTMRSHSSTGNGIDIDAVGERVDAGIVDEDVEPPESAQRLLDRALDRRRVADVHLDGDGACGKRARRTAFAVSKSMSAITTAAPLAARPWRSPARCRSRRR